MADDAGTRQPLDLREYLAIFRRRRFVIIGITIIVVVIGVYQASNRTDTFKAEGQIVVEPASAQTAAVATEAKIIESAAVHALALKTYPGAGTVAAVANPTTSLIVVSAESERPAAAAKTVNAHMDAYVSYTAQTKLDRYNATAEALRPTIEGLQQQINAFGPVAALSVDEVQNRGRLLDQKDALDQRLQQLFVETQLGSTSDIVARATPPTSPTGVTTTQFGIIALGAGLLLGIALAFVVEFLDDTIKTAAELQIAARGLPVIGIIPKTRGRRPEVVSLTAPSSAAAEAYRQLRTAVHFLSLERGTCFEVTSAKATEGKTQTIANLAVALARAGRAVTLVDCDLRRPAVHTYFNLSNSAGFTSVVLGESLSKSAQSVPDTDGNLVILTSGPLPPNPSELLASERCREVLALLRSESDFVLIDTSPVLGVTDAAALAASVDGVILVSRARFSTRRQCRRAIDILRQIGAPLVGSVLTRAARRDDLVSAIWLQRATMEADPAPPVGEPGTGSCSRFARDCTQLTCRDRVAATRSSIRSSCCP